MHRDRRVQVFYASQETLRIIKAHVSPAAGGSFIAIGINSTPASLPITSVHTIMTLHLYLGPLAALVAGLLILFVPRLLSATVAGYLILFGLIGPLPFVLGGATAMN